MKKILTIDGGGIKGMYPLSFLSKMEGQIDGRVADYFDLIVGTSTGGIIALGLGLGYKASELKEFYSELGKIVFSGNRFIRNLLRLVVSKYSSEKLRGVLDTKFKNKVLGDSSTRLVIPCLNLENGKVYVYKTAHHLDFSTDYPVDAVSVGLATASAPTFFKPHITKDGVPLVDGGLWANDPTGFACVEAVGVLGWKKSTFRVLSLGCTEQPLTVNKGRNHSLGLGYWSSKILGVVLSAQSSSSQGVAKILAGKDNVKRFSQSMVPGKFEIDKISEMSSLHGAGHTDARDESPDILSLFFKEKAKPFEPYYQVRPGDRVSMDNLPGDQIS